MKGQSVLSLCLLFSNGVAGCTGLGELPAHGPNDATTTTSSKTSPPQTTASSQPRKYSTSVFDHAGIGGPIIEGGLEYDPEDTTTRRTAIIIGSEADRRRFNWSALSKHAPDAATFINQSDLSNATILVFQETPASSSPDYRVESISQENRTLCVALNDSATGGTADLTVETVLIRFYGEAPDRVSIRTEDNAVIDITPQGQDCEFSKASDIASNPRET